jgi:hypothetical protein
VRSPNKQYGTVKKGNGGVIMVEVEFKLSVEQVANIRNAVEFHLCAIEPSEVSPKSKAEKLKNLLDKINDVFGEVLLRQELGQEEKQIKTNCKIGKAKEQLSALLFSHRLTHKEFDIIYAGLVNNE